MSVKAIPDQYRMAVPYLTCKGAAEAIEFYKKAFGAREIMRMPMPGGLVGHAELRIGEAAIMLSDECPGAPVTSPQTLGGSPVTILIYVQDVDVDALAERAIAAGAKVIRPVSNQFYGDRSVWLEDPAGHRWNFATHKEDVSPEELAKRAAAMMPEKS